VLAVSRSHRTPRRRPGRARQGPGGGGVACVGWATCARIAERAPDAACVPKPIAFSEGKQHCATEMIVRPMFDAEQNVVRYCLGYCNPDAVGHGRSMITHDGMAPTQKSLLFFSDLES
jgi:hypothetical protein